MALVRPHGLADWLLRQKIGRRLAHETGQRNGGVDGTADTRPELSGVVGELAAFGRA